MVERKAYLTFPEQGQITLLHLACIEGDLRAVDMMLRSGFDLNAKLADGKTPFFYAIQSGHILIAKLLIEYGANCHDAFTIKGYETDFFGNIKTTKKNFLPVHIAAAMNQCDMLKLLCEEYHANADYLLEDGRSCLYLACAAGHVKMALMLIKDYGLDPLKAQFELNAPLTIAQETSFLN